MDHLPRPALLRRTKSVMSRNIRTYLIEVYKELGSGQHF